MKTDCFKKLLPKKVLMDGNLGSKAKMNQAGGWDAPLHPATSQRRGLSKISTASGREGEESGDLGF